MALNDNRDPDRISVDDAIELAAKIAALCDEFKSRGVRRDGIADALVDAAVKLIDSNPFRSPGDEAALRIDRDTLVDASKRFGALALQWDKGLDRVKREAAETRRTGKAPPSTWPRRKRRTMPMPDYALPRHEADLLLLHFTPLQDITEEAILKRHAKWAARAAPGQAGGSERRVQALDRARDRLIAWLRRVEAAKVVKGPGAD